MKDGFLVTASTPPSSTNGSQDHRETDFPPSDHHTTSVVLEEDEEEAALLDKSREDTPKPLPHPDQFVAVAGEEPAVPPSPREIAKAQKKPVPWRALPRKDQLLILTLARLAEPLFQASLQAYMFFMLQSFDPSLSDAEISTQAGILAGGFTAAQCLTAVWWGKAADSKRIGRKNIVLVGLVGSFFSSIGFGFSKAFWSALLFRCLGGALNGNVGVMRTVCWTSPWSLWV